ncbi:MAG: DUF3794 domain-containing protein [Oscillospiraceae bacterium]|nr:DUF3794 domain-containing protein [Oscillospiraceae bacterium]
MDIKLTKDEVSMCDIELISGEQSFENEILLPDYYQDVMKVLKCFAKPVVLKTNLINNKIIVDGVVFIRVYYQTTDSQIRTIFSKINFSKTFDIKDDIDNIYISPKIYLDYINCRAINERKIDIKGALSIKLKIYYNLKESVLTNARGSGLQVKNDNIKNMIVLGNNNNQFVIKQDLALESSNPDISNIIKYNINIISLDKKIIDDKVILKGEVKLKVLYNIFDENNDNNNINIENNLPVSVEFILPFNQIIDLPGLSPNDDCCLDFNLIWSEITPKSDSDGRNRLILVDLGFNINIKCHKEVLSSVIVDSYSTLKEIKSENKTVNCYHVLNKIDEKITVEANIALPSANELVILDVWESPKISFVKITDGGLEIEGKTELSILGFENNVPVYIEKFIDFQTSIPIKDLDINFKYDLDIKTKDISYNLNFDNLDIKIEFLLTGCVYQNILKNILKNIEIDEEAKPKIKSEDDSLIVYYASPGESVWDLAKKYNTSISAILDENENLENNIITEKRILLIPIIS